MPVGLAERRAGEAEPRAPVGKASGRKRAIRGALFAEFLGTFAIVFFGCGAAVSSAGSPVASLEVNATFGLVVAAMVYALGPISGAHFNPAVSAGFALYRRLRAVDLIRYVGAQVAGSVAACAALATFFGASARAAGFGATVPSVDALRCVGVEAVITFFLMLVIVSVATDVRVHRAAPGLAIGMTVTLCGLVAGPLTGCGMNPARSLGPALFEGGFALRCFWIYVCGPLLGSLAAVAAYRSVLIAPVGAPVSGPARET